MHAITIQFESEDQAIGWFAAAQALGAVPDDAGLRRDRAEPQDFVVAKDEGAGRWVVESTEARERRAANPNDDGPEEEPTPAGFSCPQCWEWFPSHRDTCPNCGYEKSRLKH